MARSTGVLRAIGAAMPRGLRTTEVAAVTGLSRPTAHRILVALSAEGFVDHDQASMRWFLGPEMYLLGSVAAERYDITARAREHVHVLASITGESAFLSALRGDESVCLVREDGAFPVRSHVLYEGVRFPLGVASAGMVMLAFMPDDWIDRYLERTDLVPRFGAAHAVPAVRERIAATRATGWALNSGLLVEGSWGMGAAVFDAKGTPAWALSLNGIESRFSPERRPDLGALLLEHAHRLSLRLAG